MDNDVAEAPKAQGAYLPAKRHGDLVYVSGMTPRLNGRLVMNGPVSPDMPIEDFRLAMDQACLNALSAARSLLNVNERVRAILNLNVFIAADPSFVAHSALADLASQFFTRSLGDEAVSARAAIGVASLPGGAPLELQIIAIVDDKLIGR